MSVTLLSLGATAGTRDAFVGQIRCLHKAWRELPLAVPRGGDG